MESKVEIKVRAECWPTQLPDNWGEGYLVEFSDNEGMPHRGVVVEFTRRGLFVLSPTHLKLGDSLVWIPDKHIISYGPKLEV